MEGKGKGKGPKGDAKGDAKGKAKGKAAAVLLKPEIKPSKAMKPLWWRRLLMPDLKESIWEQVKDVDFSRDLLEERFSKVQVVPAPPQIQEEVIRLSAVAERELRLLPPPAELLQRIAELDDHLALDELERLLQLMPSTKDLEALEKAQKERPYARLGRMEEYWQVLAQIPNFGEQLKTWHFARTYHDRIVLQTEHLQDLLDMFTSFQCDALRSLLALILATGNALNAGTALGEAQGFHLELLESLHEVKGAGTSLQELIFREFFEGPEATELLESLSPLLQNVSRKVTDGHVTRVVRLTLEDALEAVETLRAELAALESSLPRLPPRLQRELRGALAAQAALERLAAEALQSFVAAKQWLQLELRSSEFCLIFDHFLLPSALLLERAESEAATVEAVFCQGETFSLQDFRHLWRLNDDPRNWEEGDPPLQRQLSRSPAEPQDQPEQAGLISLPWRKMEARGLWQTLEVASPPKLDAFAVAAVRLEEERRAMLEAQSRFEQLAEESQARWQLALQQLPKAEDLRHLLQDPMAADCPCTAQELREVEKLLGEEGLGAEYRAVLDLPNLQERLAIASFLASYRHASCMEDLEDLVDVAQCFRYSEVLCEFLGLLLAMGNHLNGGTPRGQADGFDLGDLEKFAGVQDGEGRDLRHFAMEVFCRQRPSQAEQLLRDLRPCFANVERSISKDALGTAKLSKKVVHTLEVMEQEVSGLEDGLARAERAAEVLQLEGLEEVSLQIKELLEVKNLAQAEWMKLFHFLKMKPMRTSDFCLLWDELFVPGELMVNKGKDDYFVPAFCCRDPFKREDLQVLWQIEDGEELQETAPSEGPMDAKQFCTALLPLAQSPEDFAEAAKSYSACLGTKSLGGDLGEVERGQMHLAIESLLFDPELELGVPLCPVQTDAGYHLIMARKKSRGMLSTTVSASHILVKHGRYHAPAHEASIHLPNLVGEEGDVTRTWRRWSFAHSLPPALTQLAEAQEEAEQLTRLRQDLAGQPGLQLLFRWEAAFIFNVKGVLSDISGDMIGPIHLLEDAKEPKHLGDLLTSDAARTLHPDKDGFDARLQWKNTAWQAAQGILDSESMCLVQLQLRRCDSEKPSTHSVRLRVKPTRLAYAASTPGLRLGLSSSVRVQDRAATLLQQLDSGEILVRVDNGEEENVDPRPGSVVAAASLQRKPGCSILLLLEGNGLVHAQIMETLPREQGNRHRVAYAGQERVLDLNEMNHSLQRFDSASDFEHARSQYCLRLLEEGRYIEDAITGKRVDISEQIVRLEMEVASSCTAETLRHMAFDDLEWVSDTSFRLGQRVWAHGREGVVEHLLKHSCYMVKFSDGTSSPALHASSIKRAQPIAGVQQKDFAEVRDVSQLVPLLLHPSRFLQGRLQGSHAAQPLLIRAGPGTGKTWSMQQLLFLLAQELSPARRERRLRMVPLLIPIQKLARMLRQAAQDVPSNLVLFYIGAEFQGETRRMLEQAFEMRSLIVMLDGIDEAANLKLAVEDHVTKTLVSMGVPLVLTSRPEGLRKRLYSRDFVIMNLKPLGEDQQQKIIEKQLQENYFFQHLLALSSARRQQQQLLWDVAPAEALLAAQEAQVAVTAVTGSCGNLDPEVFTAVFFCLAMRLLQDAQLDASALRLPLSCTSPGKDVQRRMSVAAQQLGAIRSDFVCSPESYLQILQSLASGVQTKVDGEAAELQLLSSKSYLSRPGVARLRYVRCELVLRFQEQSYPVEVQVHRADALEIFQQSATQEHLAFLKEHLQNVEGDFEDFLEARLQTFEEISRVPVLLSVLACALERRLPGDLFELYEMGILATLRRQVDEVPMTLELLELLAVANHTCKRRTFQALDLQDALRGRPQLLSLWTRLLEEGGVPLVKILSLGESAGEFQFSHLSFQEALFARALAAGRAKDFWAKSMNCSLNDAFYRNAFRLLRGHAVWPSLCLDQQPRLSSLGRRSLAEICGVRVRHLNLSNVDLADPADVAVLLAGLSDLETLSFARCRLAAASMVHVVQLLQKAKALKVLDLECNKHFFKVEVVAQLAQVALSLKELSLRWCHIAPAAADDLLIFLKNCGGEELSLDVEGNRGLTRELLKGFRRLKGC